MSFPFFFGLLVIWVTFFTCWNISNNEINSSYPPPRHWVGPMTWFAEWGMWTALAITLLFFLPWGISLARRRGNDVGWTTRIDDVPSFSTTRPDTSFQPTPAERDMERDVDDAFRRRRGVP